MSVRNILFALIAVAAFGLLTYLAGPPSCADLRGPEDCPAVAR